MFKILSIKTSLIKLHSLIFIGLVFSFCLVSCTKTEKVDAASTIASVAETESFSSQGVNIVGKGEMIVEFRSTETNSILELKQQGELILSTELEPMPAYRVSGPVMVLGYDLNQNGIGELTVLMAYQALQEDIASVQRIRTFFFDETAESVSKSWHAYINSRLPAAKALEQAQWFLVHLETIASEFQWTQGNAVGKDTL